MLDHGLVTRAQAGDHEAFNALVSLSIDRMYATAGLILRSDDRAQEAVQEALVNAWLGIRALRDPDRAEAWLRRLLVNACYVVARRERTRRVIELHVDPPDGLTAPDAHQALADRDQLSSAFRRLSAEQRAVLVVHHYLDLSDREAAEALGVPVGTMKSRLHRAMAALRAAIEADERRAAYVGEPA